MFETAGDYPEGIDISKRRMWPDLDSTKATRGFLVLINDNSRVKLDKQEPARRIEGNGLARLANRTIFCTMLDHAFARADLRGRSDG